MAHGSRQQDANDDLHFVAAEMRRRGDFDIVESAFLELAEPSIPEGAARCIELGAERVVLLPYFLSAGIHVTRDLMGLRRDLAVRFPAVDFRLAQPLGRHPHLLEVVTARAKDALSSATPREP